MENIERTQFVVLTGHTDDQPLPELIRRLRAQRKSGRLQVEYADGPGAFFFEDGQMVDARLGELRGVEALYAALSLGGGSFNFNPLVRPPERNIDRQGQQFIRDLVDAPRREGLAEIRAVGAAPEARGGVGQVAAPPQGAPLQLGPAAEELLAPLEGRLTAVEGAITTASRRFSRERLAYAVVIGFLVGLSFVTTLSILYGPPTLWRASAPHAPDAAAEGVAGAPAAGQQAAPGAQAQAASDDQTRRAAALKGQPPAAAGAGATATATTATAQTATPAATTAGAPATAGTEPAAVPSAAAVIGSRRFEGAPAVRREYVVEVLVEVKAGRVAEARVWNPRPGGAPYEAVALQMARERRYPETFTGGERLRIRVKP